MNYTIGMIHELAISDLPFMHILRVQALGCTIVVRMRP